jgi:hypothetical protein
LGAGNDNDIVGTTGTSRGLAESRCDGSTYLGIANDWGIASPVVSQRVYCGFDNWSRGALIWVANCQKYDIAATSPLLHSGLMNSPGAGAFAGNSIYEL